MLSVVKRRTSMPTSGISSFFIFNILRYFFIVVYIFFPTFMASESLLLPAEHLVISLVGECQQFLVATTIAVGHEFIGIAVGIEL